MHLLSLSAKTEEALGQLAERYRLYFQSNTAPFADVCFTANTSRTHFEHRLSIVATDKNEAAEKLAAHADADTVTGLYQGKKGATKIAFLFTGQGSQYVQMGRDLYESQPTFRQTIEKCDEILRAQGIVDKPLLSLLYPTDDTPRLRGASSLDETQYTQPALFALEYALAKLWESWGVVPDVVMGHSVGELVAACVAGVFSLEDGLKLVAERGRLMQATERGEMFAVEASEAQVKEALERNALDRATACPVGIAAINGPQSVVISGTRDAVRHVVAELSVLGINATRLTVSHAFHSPLMEPILADFLEVARQVSFSPPKTCADGGSIAFISNMTGQLATGETAYPLGIATPEYWVRHVRQPVRFDKGMASLIKEADLFVEIGPQPVLLGMGRHLYGERFMWLPSLRQGRQDWSQLLESLAQLYVRGVEIDWEGFAPTGHDNRDYARQKLVPVLSPRRKEGVVLPTYPWKKERHWIDTTKIESQPRRLSAHPLLGQRLRSALKEVQFESQISATRPAFLSEHRIYQTTVFPVAGYLEMALAAAAEVIKSDNLQVESLHILQALTWAEKEKKTLQLILTPTGQADRGYEFQIFSLLNESTSDWTLHASGEVQAGAQNMPRMDLAALQAKMTLENTASDDLRGYRKTNGNGPHPLNPPLPTLGEGEDLVKNLTKIEDFCKQNSPSPKVGRRASGREVRARPLEFSDAVIQLWRGEGVALAEIRLPYPKGTLSTSMMEQYQLYPPLLNRGLQVLMSALPKGHAVQEEELSQGDASLSDPSDSLVVIGIKRFLFYPTRRTGLKGLWSYGQVHPREDQIFWTADLYLLTPDGKVIAKAEGIQFKHVSRSALLGFQAQAWQDWLYEVAWQQKVRFGLPPEYMPTPKEISSHLTSSLRPQRALWISHSVSELERYQRALTELEGLSVAYILSAFEQMGWALQDTQYPKGTQFFTNAQIADRLGISSQYERLLGRLLSILAEEGIVQRRDAEWRVISRPLMQEPEAYKKRLFSKYPIIKSELLLLGRCGHKLADVLRGTCNPLALLFPEGDLSTTTALYQDSLGAQMMNQLVQQVVLSALEHLPPYRGARILEIGAGTGGTTSYLLPHLDSQRTEYLFTDISPLFLSKAADAFRDYPFVRYQVLDIEQEPKTQGFGEHEYDLIVAANVLHATKDLEQTLSHIRQLLAKGGMLVLLEGTVRQYWVDLTFGLTEGWWRFTDHALRPDYPLLNAPQWQQLLLKCGFLSIDTIFPEQKPQGALSQAVIVAQNSEAYEMAKPEKRKWLILADSSGVGEQLSALLQSAGEASTLVFLAEAYERLEQQEFRLSNTLHDFGRLLREAGTSWRGVVHLWSLDAAYTGEDSKRLEAASKQGCGSALHLVQALVKEGLSPALWLVTGGAQPVIESDSIPSVVQSTLWGLGQVIAQEHPELNCKLIDLDPQSDSRRAAQLLFKEVRSKEVRSPATEARLAFRQGYQYVPRLMRSRRELNSSPLHLSPDGTYLITGGTKGIGLAVAQWMVSHSVPFGYGAKHLVLVARRSPDLATRKVLDELELMGAQVITAQADVSEKEQIAKVLTQIEQPRAEGGFGLPPLRGIIHSAGVFDDQLLRDHRWEYFSKVFAPKVAGSWNLHLLTKERPLDFFVLFSSAASMLGTAGLSNYVAANTFLDALAHYRRSLGLTALSINWGVWKEVGMAAAVGQSREDQWEVMGVNQIEPKQALLALEQLLMSDIAQMGVFSIEWSKLLGKGDHEPTFIESALLRDHARRVTHAGQVAFGAPVSSQFRAQLDSAPEHDRYDLLVTHVKALLSETLGLQEAVSLRQGFFELGMDSLMAMEFRNRLQASLECHLPPTLIFKYPRLDALLDYLAQDVLGITKQEHLPSPNQEVDEEAEFNNSESAEEIAKQFAEQLGLDWGEFDE